MRIALMNNNEKDIILGLFSSDESKRTRCINILFYGIYKDGRLCKTPYSKAIENAVRKFFSGNKFYDRFDEVYSTFVSFFFDYVQKLGPGKLLETDKLDSWLFTVACHFAANKYYRKQVCDTLGIKEDIDLSEISIDDNYNTDVVVSVQNEEGERHDIGIHAKIPDDDDNESIWAESLIKKYIDQIPHEYYRTVIRVLVLEGASREEFALEMGKKVTAINNDVSRAMSSLMQVALPDIRWRTKQLYSLHKDDITQDDRIILDQFYLNSKPIEKIAEELSLKENELRLKILSSFNELKKMVSIDPVEYGENKSIYDYEQDKR